MGLRYYGKNNYKKRGGLNWSVSKRGFNSSWTFDLGLLKFNVPLLTSTKRRSRLTLKGSGLFRIKG